jgi:chromosome segregation ATPase
MLWLVGMAAAVLISALSDDEKEARERWDRKRSEVADSVSRHNRAIKMHIHDAQSSYRFAELANAHYASARTANCAYTLLNDAKKSISGLSRVLGETMTRKNACKADLPVATAEQRRALFQEIKLLNQAITTLYEDLGQLKIQKNTLYEQVKQLNTQTAMLKNKIKEDCGTGGKEWYQRLAQRNALRH